MQTTVKTAFLTLKRLKDLVTKKTNYKISFKKKWS